MKKTSKSKIITTPQILRSLNKLLDPKLDPHTLSYEFYNVAVMVKVAGKKMDTYTDLKFFAGDMFLIQFTGKPEFNRVLKRMYEKSKKKLAKNRLTIFYHYNDTFLGLLDNENSNHQLLMKLIDDFNQKK